MKYFLSIGMFLLVFATGCKEQPKGITGEYFLDRGTNRIDRLALEKDGSMSYETAAGRVMGHWESYSDQTIRVKGRSLRGEPFFRAYQVDPQARTFHGAMIIKPIEGMEDQYTSHSVTKVQISSEGRVIESKSPAGPPSTAKPPTLEPRTREYDLTLDQLHQLNILFANWETLRNVHETGVPDGPSGWLTFGEKKLTFNDEPVYNVWQQMKQILQQSKN